MEEKFRKAWERCRREAEALGVRIRPIEADALAQARRILSGHRPSEGFAQLEKLGRLDLSLEALAVSSAYTPLFDDTQANHALELLMESGFFG